MQFRTRKKLSDEDHSEASNVTHVFSSGQNLYFYYEVYDPGREAGDKNAVLRISEVGVADQVSWI